MLTSKDKKWLLHLPDDNKIQVFPYDSNSAKKFLKLKQKIQEVLGKNTKVIHRGASSLGISGQGELDVYIPVSANQFNSLLKPLAGLFGKPGSVYPLERARFVTYIDGTKAEVFLINKKSKGWLGGLKFEKYLKKHPKILDEYRKLKEESSGLSTREYYRRKTGFINMILEKRE